MAAGMECLQQGQHAEAEGFFRQLLDADPNDPEALYHQGAVLQDQGRLGDAADSYRRILALYPDNPETLGNLGIVLYRLGEGKEALSSFRRVLAANPSDAIALATAGVILFEQGDFDEAGRMLKQAAGFDERLDYGRVSFLGDEWRSRADPEKFDILVSALPEMSGDMPPSSGDGPVVMTSCDPVYFRQFGKALALSVGHYAPGVDFHLHVINPDPPLDDEIRDLRGRMGETSFTVSTETAPGAGTLYYPVVRFIRLGQILEATGREFLHLDADSLVRGPLASLAAIDAGADLSIPSRFEDHVLKYKVLISSLFVRPSAPAIRFMRRFGTFLANCIVDGDLVWCLDQTAFYITYRMMQFDGETVSLQPMPQALCDHDLDEGSDVWAAKGDLKENPAYERECARLLGTGA